MTPAEADNPYARQTAYGRMPQAPFRIGPLPKAAAPTPAPPKPAPSSPPRAAGVLSGSAIPLTPRQASPPAEPAPPQAETPQPLEAVVVPIDPARAAPGRGRWLAAGAVAAILTALGAAFLILGRGPPEPAPPANVIADAPPLAAPQAAPPPVDTPAAPAAAAPAALKATVRAAAPATRAPLQAPAVVEAPAAQPAPVIAPPPPPPPPPPPVLNLPQTAPALREPLDPDAPISNAID